MRRAPHPRGMIDQSFERRLRRATDVAGAALGGGVPFPSMIDQSISTNCSQFGGSAGGGQAPRSTNRWCSLKYSQTDRFDRTSTPRPNIFEFDWPFMLLAEKYIYCSLLGVLLLFVFSCWCVSCPGCVCISWRCLVVWCVIHLLYCVFWLVPPSSFVGSID